MQTTAPTQSAIGEYHSPVQPSATKIVQVRISVAIVMPEIGLEDDPIRPTMREDTVTKKKPKTTTSTDATTLPCVGRRGATARNTASRTVPASTRVIGMSRSVRVRALAAFLALRSRRLSRN